MMASNERKRAESREESTVTIHNPTKSQKTFFKKLFAVNEQSMAVYATESVSPSSRSVSVDENCNLNCREQLTRRKVRAVGK